MLHVNGIKFCNESILSYFKDNEKIKKKNSMAFLRVLRLRIVILRFTYVSNSDRAKTFLSICVVEKRQKTSRAKFRVLSFAIILIVNKDQIYSKAIIWIESTNRNLNQLQNVLPISELDPQVNSYHPILNCFTQTHLYHYNQIQRSNIYRISFSFLNKGTQFRKLLYYILDSIAFTILLYQQKH